MRQPKDPPLLRAHDVIADGDRLTLKSPPAPATFADTDPILLTLQQAARYSGVPYGSLRKLVLDGTLPGVSFAGMKRTWIKRADLDQLIERSTIATAR